MPPRPNPADSGAPVAGVAFPVVDGSRSTTAFGRHVVASALQAADPVGAAAALAEPSWRHQYPTHFRRLVEAGLPSAAAAVAVARAGLAAAEAMVWVDADGERSLAEAVRSTPQSQPVTESYAGAERRVTELSLPLADGRSVAGAALMNQVSDWVAEGSLEPSGAESLTWVVAHPECLSLPGKTLVALGVGAEIGPVPHLLRWGATVAGVDLKRPELWQRVLTVAEHTGGSLMFPAVGGMADPSARAGLDVLAELPTVAHWLLQLPGDLVVGNYLYADGSLNTRTSAAGDALAALLVDQRPDTVVAALATPTDVFAVPASAVEHSVARYAARPRSTRLAGQALGGATRGRLLQPAYRPGADPGICDALVVQQGPNYALGKRLQRWRAVVEADAGRRTSLVVAPPTRTRSVVKNRALAAAYAGAHRFGVRVFEPQTTGALMAALLVYDLYADRPAFDHPWQAEAHNAVHGGLWRAPYSPRSALGLAALMGWSRPR